MSFFSFRPDLMKTLQKEEKLEHNVEELNIEKRKLLAKVLEFQSQEERVRQEINNLIHLAADKNTDSLKRKEIVKKVAELRKHFSEEAETERRAVERALRDLTYISRILNKEQRLDKEVIEQLAA